MKSMRICNLEVFNLRHDVGSGGFLYGGGQLTGRVTSLARVTTEDGSTGWGAAYSHPTLVRVILETHLKPMIVGKDAADIAGLWNRMYRMTC